MNQPAPAFGTATDFDHLPPVDRLRAIMHRLRAPGGCPWDAEQTHESLLPHLIEEAYEVAEAVRSGERDAIVDELGDLLLQPIFHAFCLLLLFSWFPSSKRRVRTMLRFVGFRENGRICA